MIIQRFALIAFLCCSSMAFAQHGTVRGFVLDPQGNPIINAPILLEGTEFRIETNDHGYFFLAKIPPGTYTLTLAQEKQDTMRQEIQLGPNQVLTHNMEPKGDLPGFPARLTIPVDHFKPSA